MDDLLSNEKVEYILEVYTGLRNQFYNGSSYDPHQENIQFTKEYLKLQEDHSEFSNTVEYVDLFLANVHTLYSIRNDELASTPWDSGVDTLKEFLYDREGHEDDAWCHFPKDLIHNWVSGINSPLEIPY